MTDRDNRRTGSPAALTGLFVIAVIAVLYLAADLLIPIAFALLFNLLLSPVVGWMSDRHIPASVGASLLVLAMIATIFFALAKLAEPANQWLEDAPKTVRELQQHVAEAQGNLANIQALADEVDQLAVQGAEKSAQAVVVSGPGVIESVLGGLPSVAAFVGIVVFLTFFLLASGERLHRRITSCGRTLAERRRIVRITRQIRTDLSRYLATVTVINAVLGAAVALTMYILEVPNPLLWGVMVYLLNFAPYVGALTSAAVFTLVGLMTFDNLGSALAVPASFLCLTIIEGQLVTPAVLGRRMSLSPIVVFLSVICWGWLWGIAGALMAVPIVTCIKVICDHIPRWNFVSMLLRNAHSQPGSIAFATPSMRDTQPEEVVRDATAGD